MSSVSDQLTEGPPASRTGPPVGRGDILGMTWVLVSGLAILVPVFIHGWILGPFDLISRDGLTSQSGVSLHIFQNGDLINSLIPWSDTVWQQVRQGHLPLWNPYGGLGMPLAFNWQSAPFSLPALVGYLAPLRYAFTVGVVVNIVVSGSGAYVLGRVLGMGAMASAAVGTVFELSGPITAWLGYPFPAVMSWAGWMFAFGLLILRGRHRAGYVVALAGCTALSLYGGAPEGFVVLMTAFVVFFAVVLFCRTRWLGGAGDILRPAFDLAVAMVAGCALAAPFALPGLQTTSQSIRNTSGIDGALKLYALTYLAIPAFDGLPIFHHGRVVVFGYTYFYVQTAMYVGVSALVLAGIAIVLRRGRAEVRGFSTVFIASLAVVFIQPVVSLVAKLPLLGHVEWLRALMPMALAIAVLAGFGLDLVVRSATPRKAGQWLGAGFGVAALALIATWLFGRGHLGPVDASVRAHSFIWPAVETVVGLAAASFLLWTHRSQRRILPDTSGSDRSVPPGSRLARAPAGAIAGLVVLTALTAFLVSSGATMMQSSSSSFPQTPVIQAFSKTVGSSTVAFGSPGCQLGFDPNVNDVYGVQELEVYDPIIPKDYFTAWLADTHSPPGLPAYNLFCPVVTSVSVAREFGVAYVLEASGHRGPTGSVYVGRFAGEALYRVPGSGAATVTPLSHGELPADLATGKPISVHHSSPSEWNLKTSSSSPQVLRLHLSDVPGWHASIDGKPLVLEQYAGMMLQARIPAGDHTIVLHYWPETLTYGIILAICSAVFLAALLVVASLRHRKRSGSTTPGEGVSDVPAS
jgi:hypothetical protein